MVLGGHGVEPVRGGEDGVDVGHAPFVRDGRGGQTYQIHFEARWGAERRVPEDAGPAERQPARRKTLQKNLAEKFAAVTPGDCGGQLVRVRYAPIATKFRGAPK
jgi:hypothetical protein